MLLGLSVCIVIPYGSMPPKIKKTKNGWLELKKKIPIISFYCIVTFIIEID